MKHYCDADVSRDYKIVMEDEKGGVTMGNLAEKATKGLKSLL